MRKKIRFTLSILLVFGFTSWAQDEEAEKAAEKALKKGSGSKL